MCVYSQNTTPNPVAKSCISPTVRSCQEAYFPCQEECMDPKRDFPHLICWNLSWNHKPPVCIWTRTYLKATSTFANSAWFDMTIPFLVIKFILGSKYLHWCVQNTVPWKIWFLASSVFSLISVIYFLYGETWHLDFYLWLSIVNCIYHYFFFFYYRSTISVDNKMSMVNIPPTHPFEVIYGVKMYVFVFR